MKIIFVDFDGPLIPRKMHLFHQNRKSGIENHPQFDEFAVRVFNLWTKYSNAKIVFSTAWEYNYTADELKEIVKHNGLGFDYHNVCVTPKKMTMSRHTEILNWLEEHSQEGDKFIVVDDDAECRHIHTLLETGYYADNIKATGEWVNVDFTNGLSLENFYHGCAVLGIDREILEYKEFGVKILTAEEKASRDLLMRSMI